MGDADAQHKAGLAHRDGRGVLPDYAAAIRLFLAAAEQGHADAQRELIWILRGTARKRGVAATQDFAAAQFRFGIMCRDGAGVSQNLREAFRWFRDAAKLGHVEAQFELGIAHRDGTGTRRDRTEAVRRLHKAAAQGHPEAQRQLELVYCDALLGHPKTAQWLRDAADRGDADAQYELGNAYRWGKGARQDDAEAMKLLGLAADQGHATAQRDLEQMQRIAELKQAADRGDADAQYQLGIMYRDGQEVSQDLAEATRRFLAASKQGHTGAQRELTQGDASAQFHLGMAYCRGGSHHDVPVPEDPGEGVRWLHRSAEQGNIAAQFSLGCAYSSGMGVEQDHAESAKWHRRAAGQGNGQSKFRLGDAYFCGMGVEQNDTEAMKWYRQAADRGHADAQRIVELVQTAEQGDGVAQFRLGIRYRDGKALAKAARWFQAAAAQGDGVAQYQLGLMFRDGQGVPQDYTEAVRWLRAAADQGHEDAQYELAIMHRDGRGVPKNPVEAVRLLSAAAELDHVDALFALAKAYHQGEGEIERDYRKAAELYFRAAKYHHAGAKFQLGILYRDGKGVSQNLEEASRWLHSAAKRRYADAQRALDQVLKHIDLRVVADRGNAEAQYELGIMLRGGKGAPQDFAEAVRLLRAAAKQGFADAQPELDQVLKHVELIQKAEQGDADAQCSLGFAYGYRQGVKVNHEEAVKWWRLAADQGDADAQHALGHAYLDGRGVEQNLVAAYVWLSLAAKHNREAGEERDDLAKQMTAEQIMEARLNTLDTLARVLRSAAAIHTRPPEAAPGAQPRAPGAAPRDAPRAGNFSRG